MPTTVQLPVVERAVGDVERRAISARSRRPVSGQRVQAARQLVTVGAHPDPGEGRRSRPRPPGASPLARTERSARREAGAGTAIVPVASPVESRRMRTSYVPAGSGALACLVARQLAATGGGMPPVQRSPGRKVRALPADWRHRGGSRVGRRYRAAIPTAAWAPTNSPTAASARLASPNGPASSWKTCQRRGNTCSRASTSAAASAACNRRESVSSSSSPPTWMSVGGSPCRSAAISEASGSRAG